MVRKSKIKKVNKRRNRDSELALEGGDQEYGDELDELSNDENLDVKSVPISQKTEVTADAKGYKEKIKENQRQKLTLNGHLQKQELHDDALKQESQSL